MPTHNRLSRFTFVASGIFSAALIGTIAPALAQSITIDGSTTQFNPPPIERSGRVFVPLRGVFERLGASVVYQAGVINATGPNGTVSLRIGSNQATVNGQPQTLDVAPFIIGASTYVPLRFVSQALGATVNYDGVNRIVAITTNGGGSYAPAPTYTSPPVVSAVRLTGQRPRDTSTVRSTKPTIQSDFSALVDPNSVRIYLDGLDVTNASTRSTSGFVYAPPSPLQSMQHTVRVTGRDQSGNSFDQSWSFTTGTAQTANSITVTAPANGGTVSASSFTLSGRTVPNARVHIVAGAVGSVGGVFSFGAGNYTGDTIADGSGYFSQNVSLQTLSGAQIGLTVTSTDPVTNESAEARLQLRAQ